MIGLTIRGVGPRATLDLIEEADRAGVDSVWLQGGGVSPDPLTLFAAAAARTERIQLGSGIIPTWPRHPVLIAQQVLVLEALAPGRIRLGIGPSTAGAMQAFGVEFRRPLTQLREYLVALQALLKAGSVTANGEFVRARARIATTLPTPVMASALNEGAFALCGEVADGAISWLCPPAYVRSRALPALRRGAARAGRVPPPVVLHVPICQEEDPKRVAAAASAAFGAYTTYQFYSDMFAAAGHPPNGRPEFSQALTDALVVYGTDEQIRARLRTLLGDGIGELMVTPIALGDTTEATSRAIALLAGPAV